MSTGDTAADSKESLTDARPRRRLPLWWIGGLVVIGATLVATFFSGFLATGWGGTEIHAPGVADFFPEAIFGEGTFFEFNRLTLARFIAAGVLIAVIAVVTWRATLIPTRGQAVLEMLAEFVRRSIGIDTLGEARGRRYSVTLATVFFGVLAMNLTGFIPGINIAASSVVAVPLVFAVFVYISFIVAGIRERGGKFFKEQLVLPGVPAPMHLLLVPIEAVSTFVIRPATLTIRLLANMISGHLLLAITYLGTQTLMVSGWGTRPLALLTFAGTLAVTGFEIFVALLQAYVFTILTAVYIKLSVESH